MSNYLFSCSERLDEAACIIAYVQSMAAHLPQDLGRPGQDAEHGLYIILGEAERRIKTVSKRICKASKGETCLKD